MATLKNCTGTLASFTGVPPVNACNNKGGIAAVYVANGAHLDLNGMSSTTYYNASTRTLNNILMLGGNLFYEISTSGETTAFTSELQDNGNYLNTLTMFFDGATCGTMSKVLSLSALCPLVVFIQFNNCTQLVSLVDASSSTAQSLRLPPKPVKVTGNSITSGTLEGDKSSQVVTISWISPEPPICANIQNIPTP